jgi:hypothetical protein|tara:strand:- start:70 stop:939 length:870 start_codon:yes stop_codon:yes gene_type:complete
MVDFASGLLLLKSIWESIKGTRKIKKDDSNLLKDKEIRKDFLNNNPNASIIYINGNLYLGDTNQLNNSDKEKLKEIYSPLSDSKKNFDIIKSDFFYRVQDLKKELPNNKNINPFLKFLDYDLKTILNLSIYSKKLFDDGRSKEAQKIMDEIGLQYGKEGRKLCNLYSSGYINSMTDFLIKFYGDDIEKAKKEINPTIRKFLKQSDYILFIHHDSDKEDISNEIKMFILGNKPYIAIHGAGSTNISKIKEILIELEDEILGANYEVNEENLKTLSLCPLLHVYFTKKKKD